MGENKSIFAVYANLDNVEEAIRALKDAGFSRSDISILFPKKPGGKELATQKNLKAPEDAATDGGSGAVIGSTLGWLLRIGEVGILVSVHCETSDQIKTGKEILERTYGEESLPQMKHQWSSSRLLKKSGIL